VTTWVQNPEGGRERGPRGIARAWAEALVRPRRFFRNGVAPGDQAPGLVFAVVVAVAYVSGLFAFVPGRLPSLGGGPAVSAFVGLALVALLVAPAVLHLTAALQTVLLIVLVRNRAGVSETVQVIGYATAPCVFAWVPVPGVAALCGLYATGLLVVGLAVVHRTSLLRAAVAGIGPAVLVFGIGFGGLRAGRAILGLVGN